MRTTNSSFCTFVNFLQYGVSFDNLNNRCLTQWTLVLYPSGGRVYQWYNDIRK
ncbi:hypothetical protein Hanom_Chr02g00174821 [Helianthus anomalus]